MHQEAGLSTKDHNFFKKLSFTLYQRNDFYLSLQRLKKLMCKDRDIYVLNY